MKIERCVPLNCHIKRWVFWVIHRKSPALGSSINFSVYFVSIFQGNPTIFIESNIHAREWVTSATSTFILNEFLTSQDEDVRDLAESFDWVFVPVFNVDGFEYTHSTVKQFQYIIPWNEQNQINVVCHLIESFMAQNSIKLWILLRRRSESEFWLSSRRFWSIPFIMSIFIYSSIKSYCVKNLLRTESGSSWFPCSQIYAGPKPFSEVETEALSEFIKTFNNIKIYLSFHSYSQLLLFPYVSYCIFLRIFQEIFLYSNLLCIIVLDIGSFQDGESTKLRWLGRFSIELHMKSSNCVFSWFL